MALNTITDTLSQIFVAGGKGHVSKQLLSNKKISTHEKLKKEHEPTYSINSLQNDFNQVID